MQGFHAGALAMTHIFQRISEPSSLLSEEDVLPRMQCWQAEGRRTALVTLIGVAGEAPRQPGAQMAVTEDGRYAGYLSGGCLERAVVLEAQAVIASGANRILRYGRGSPYFDIQLPCGSGLDIYFDQAIGAAPLGAMMAHRAARQSFVLRTDLSSGHSSVDLLEPNAVIEQSRLEASVFNRVYVPTLRLLMIGNNPTLVGLAALAAATGVETKVVTADSLIHAGLAASFPRIKVAMALEADIVRQLDFTTAAALFFNAHDDELEIFHRLVKTDCFYIGALGNHRVHRERLAALSAHGISDRELARIHAPVGVISSAKSKATLAVGVLAEVLQHAKALNLIC